MFYIHKKIYVFFIYIFILAAFSNLLNAFENNIKISPISMDFFGNIQKVNIGDILTVKDPDGIICGKFVINKKNKYGFIHVYGDDPSTSIDEGAKPGDILTFLLNNNELNTQNIVWIGDRIKKRIDID